MAVTNPFVEAVSAFGTSTKAKLSNIAVVGAAEDQLRAPLEKLIHDLAMIAGFPIGSIDMVGETSLSDLATRPDYAVVAHKALVGFIEVKAPGKGADPRRFNDPHDKDQWKKLKSLPNLLYTDGNAFSIWRDGELQGSIVRLEGDVESSGSALTAPTALLPLISDFLGWHPVPPRNPKQLAEIAARLCRLLRDEVVEQIARGSVALTELAKDWRVLLFPQATDDEFADGYAQAVTFGLLVARAKDISLAGGIDHAAQELRKTDSLIGTALRLLTDDTANQDALKTSLGTLTRVLEEVNWSTLSKGNTDAWLYFYEDFLEVYDNALRKRTGSYYTPPEVVSAMVRLVDDALRSPDLFDRPSGFASADVIVADPAVGTGTFLLGVLRQIAAIIEDDQGPGAVPAAIEAAARRLIGFELQFGPFAVAQLRLLAEMHALTNSTQVPNLRLFITDTLGNPYAEEERLPQMLQPIGKSRRDANAVKRGEPITVVIGNPPYKEKAKGRGGWIEAGSDGRIAPMDRWSPPKAWGVGAHSKHLKNLYVYFWRWATWKVFGSGVEETTGEVEKDRAGIVCFITVAGFLNGPGFEKMRDDLRRDCTEIWVIDCSPEGYQPDVPTRLFEGVQQPVCIVLAARKPAKNRTAPARLRFYALPEGKREEKFKALAEITLDGPEWADGPSGWRDPFLPVSGGAWGDYPMLEDLFIYNGSGVMPGRTWVIAPDEVSLAERWTILIREKAPEKREILFHPHQNGDKTSIKPSTKGLPGHEKRLESVAKDTSAVVTPVRYAFRTLDRQWIIPDNRLLNRPNPTLWDAHSSQQVYLTGLEAHSPTSGPAVSFAGQIPDLHHYKGIIRRPRFSALERSSLDVSNVKLTFRNYLATALGVHVIPEDVVAYLGAVMAHPGFITRFSSDLVRPGLRVPMTADAALFNEAVSLGREVVWLQCYGERFADPAAARPSGPPRLPKGEGPSIPLGGAIPGAPEPLPDTIDYDPALKRLKIGKGYIDNVPKTVWDYEISGKNVLRQWFSYRKLDRVIPPFLAGFSRRISRNHFQFLCGSDAADAHIGPLVVVGP
ncbi:type ISP restriction/modification enzyme [Aquamicrobium defluvii]|uniref:site-specific DNA-methyltransferase (adenine-specific) n=1 Tax=Aquamicrobium defluvii TaxID=69279 RepID=A0A4R6YDQ7_9HYPH|nr:type ISP restriction/modification enzyme [Aquamicrobium defluvii]TDR34136.1 N-6 DNA methylase [Aquamicrobium defluvii]